MKLTLLLAALALCNTASAAEPAAFYGEADCKVAPITPAPKNGAVKWTGPCKDGYADGAGVLQWSAADKGLLKVQGTLAHGEISGEATMTGKFGTYIGTFRQGQPDGQGYFKFQDGKQYEGPVAKGEPEGVGIEVAADGSRYDGQWKNGKRNGFGKQVYTLGGSYEGQWKDDEFDGKGVIVHVGSGRRAEGLFREGHLASSPHAETEKGVYSLKADYYRTGSRIREDAAIGFGPLNATWEQLTPRQQNLVKSFYKTLEDGDQPPYPLHGTGKVYADVVKVRHAAFANVTGELNAYVQVGKDGKPQSVATFGGVTNPEFKRGMSAVLMLQEFKPAVCHGEPCAMIYPMRFSFTLED